MNRASRRRIGRAKASADDAATLVFTTLVTMAKQSPDQFMVFIRRIVEVAGGQMSFEWRERVETPDVKEEAPIPAKDVANG